MGRYKYYLLKRGMFNTCFLWGLLYSEEWGGGFVVQLSKVLWGGENQKSK